MRVQKWSRPRLLESLLVWTDRRGKFPVYVADSTLATSRSLFSPHPGSTDLRVRIIIEPSNLTKPSRDKSNRKGV